MVVSLLSQSLMENYYVVLSVMNMLTRYVYLGLVHPTRDLGPG